MLRLCARHYWGSRTHGRLGSRCQTFANYADFSVSGQQGLWAVARSTSDEGTGSEHNPRDLTCVERLQSVSVWGR